MSDTVLIVDDDETTLRVLELLLARAGYEVVRAGSAEDGLRKAYRFQPDIVLLDVNMPQMDGWEMCHRLREMSDVPILFLAASASSEDVVRGLELGADDFIAKPFDPQELLARIKAHLRRAPRSAPSEEPGVR
ncbi:MAG: response regulator transcription factor [Chloroflexi bacterium]|nr:response regulator transcription factor [Chloroflexota bacterium]